jgi:hypothetical protein
MLVTALMGAALVWGSAPTGAATTKTFTPVCTDPDGLLASLGIAPPPVTATVEAPAFVEPGQTGVPVSVSYSVLLDAKLVDLALGAGGPTLALSNVKSQTVVSGPPATSTTSIPGDWAGTTITLTAGQPATIALPKFEGTLNDIGSGGVIKLSSQSVQFTVTVVGKAVTVTCTTGVTIATIPIKIAGSPDIVQPIDVDGAEGQDVTVDVLADFVTNGRTKDGVEQQVDPSTLKVLEGNATVVDGKIVAVSPAAGTSADVTFEVCAGTVEIAPADPGTSEVQELRIFREPATDFSKRMLGARFALGGGPGAPLWTAQTRIGGLPWAPPFVPDEATNPNWWSNNVNNFAIVQSDFRYPSAAELQASLESVPGIGAGNVKVTRGTVQSVKGTKLQYMPFNVEFTGALARTSVNPISVAKMYSFLPTEILDNLLALAGSAGGGGGGGGTGPKYPIPAGDLNGVPINGDAKAYVDYLQKDIGNYIIGTQDWQDAVALWAGVLGENITAVIDIDAALKALTSLFIPKPETVTLTQGEDPVAAQTQELCSQGVITLTSAAETPPPAPPTDGVPPGGQSGPAPADLAFAG